MICKNCGRYFPVTMVIDGKHRNLCKRKYCLDCSPFGRHNTKPVGYVKSHGQATTCDRCKKEYVYDKSKGATTRLCASCVVNKRKHRVKKLLVEACGGKCSICHYNKCMSALEFHHLDPSQKDFSISGNHCRKFKLLLEEARKCVLVCANCHREIHSQGDAFIE